MSSPPGTSDTLVPSAKVAVKKNKGGRPRAFAKVEDLEEALDNYKEYLEENNKPPTIAGFAYYTGVDRETIYNYQRRDEYFGLIKRFRDWIMMNYEELAIEKGNGGIVFLLKIPSSITRSPSRSTGTLSKYS